VSKNTPSSTPKTEQREQTSIDDFLALCCAKSPSRYAITKPFRKGEYVYATDGRIIARVPAAGRAEPESDTMDGVKTPPCLDLPWDRSRYAMAAATIPDGPDPEWESCVRCGGSGDCTDCDCGNSHECGRCKGTGGNIANRHVSLGSFGVGTVYLSLMRHGRFVLYPSLESPATKPIYFCRDDGVDGLLMPMTPLSGGAS